MAVLEHFHGRGELSGGRGEGIGADQLQPSRGEEGVEAVL